MAAVSVGAQQHGMVCLDEDGEVVRPALLWNDTRSAGAAADLVRRAGAAGVPGPTRSASCRWPSFTITKLRWLAEHEPANADRMAAVCLPHDWLTWRLAGAGALDALRTDRGDASGTGYWSPATSNSTGRTCWSGPSAGSRRCPGCWPRRRPAAPPPDGVPLGPGTGDNAAAALGVGAVPGDVIVSIGTSGTVFSRRRRPAADPTGTVAGFADATGGFLPLVATLNAARVLDAAARLLGVDLASCPTWRCPRRPARTGWSLVPYLEGERTPNRPDATGALHGLRLATATPAHLARAAVEGMLCALADGLDALVAQGVPVRRVILVGGGAQSAAVRRIAPTVFGVPVLVPPPGEYVADGAARQAAWVLAGGATPPAWQLSTVERYEADPVPAVRARYAEARDLTVNRPT